MDPINITSVSTPNLQQKHGTLSNYAQRYMKSQIKSTSFALERFFSETDPEQISQKEERLKEIGIKQVGRDAKEGILISDEEYDYHVFSADDGYVGFDILKPDSEEVYQHFRVNDKNDKYIYSGDFRGLNTEDEMSRVLDVVSGKLYQAKHECTITDSPKPFIPDETTAKKITDINKALQSTTKNTEVNNAGFIGDSEKELIESINNKLRISEEMYKNIKDGRTKWEVKKSYPNYLPQPVANKFGFKNIGPRGESVCLFSTTYKNRAFDAIMVTDTEGNELNFVISKDKGCVQKNPPSKFVKSENSDYRIFIKPDYYTQKEIDESDLPVYLDCFNKEMDKFIQHTQNWFDKKAEIKLIKSNHDVAVMDDYKEQLDDIHTNFTTYQTKMRKYLRKPHKSRKFKTENGISTKITTTAVKFDNITPEGYDLRLSYPKVHDKTAMQLLVMQGDEVKDSYYVINDKLLRFDIKDTNDKIRHYNQKLYYYDKKHLEASNFGNYLSLIQDKLHELNGKLDVIRAKQLENKARYHIKTKEEKAQ